MKKRGRICLLKDEAGWSSGYATSRTPDRLRFEECLASPVARATSGSAKAATISRRRGERGGLPGHAEPSAWPVGAELRRACVCVCVCVCVRASA